MAGSHRAPTRAGRRWTSAAIAATGVAGALAAAPSASGDPIAVGLATTVVTPDNAADKGFSEPDTRAPGDVAFTEAYGDPNSTTDGALGLTTPDGSSKATYFTQPADGTELEEFATSASYATYKDSDSTGNAIQYPSYQIAVDRNGGALESGDFSTLYYEPYYNVDDPASDLQLDTWQTWDVTSGGLCSTKAIGGFEGNQTRCDNGGLKTISEIAAANPGATVLSWGLNQGSGNPGIVAAADDLEGAGTTYDFELKEPPVVIPDPAPDPTPDPDDEPPAPDDPKGDPSDDHDGDDWGKDDWGKDEHHGKHRHSEHHHGEHHHADGDDEDCPDE